MEDRLTYYHSEDKKFRQEYRISDGLKSQVDYFLEKENIVKSFKDNREQFQNLADALFNKKNRNFFSSVYRCEISDEKEVYYLYQNFPNFESRNGLMPKDMEEYETVKSFINYVLDKKIVFRDWMLDITHFTFDEFSFSRGENRSKKSTFPPLDPKDEYVSIQIFYYDELTVEYIYSPNKNIRLDSSVFKEFDPIRSKAIDYTDIIEPKWYYKIKKSIINYSYIKKYKKK